MSLSIMRACLSCLLLTAAPTGASAASTGLLAPESLSALIDLRLVAADGERSWTDGGFGKARFGGDDDGDPLARPVVAEATLVWQPPLSWDVSGTVVAAYQHEQDEPVDLIEAFLTYKPVPKGATRFSARAGLYWPAISLEHAGPAWSVSGMITPSAINAWVGEEVKVVGLEGSAAHEGAAGEVSATIGVFGFNDTAGTLLAFRGWALHDLKAGAFGHQPLPPLGDAIAGPQAPTTKPLIELDGRPGYYGRIAWRMAMAPLSLEALWYDNRGDPTAVRNRQWGWDTRFLALGASADLGRRTRLLAQAMTGRTEMGFRSPDLYWVDTRFRSAYLRLIHERGPLTLSARADLFDTREQGSRMSPREESEDGWAAALATSWRLSDRIELLAEVLHVESTREARVRVDVDPRQRQTVVQAAVRLTL